MIQNCLDYIKEHLQTIDGIENVFQQVPFVRTTPALHSSFGSDIVSDLLTDDESFQAWEVSNVSGQESLSAGNVDTWTDTIHLHGWLKFSGDDSSKQMQYWIDQIKSLFRTNTTLGKTVHRRGALRFLTNQPDWFYTILAHHCQFELAVELYYSV